MANTNKRTTEHPMYDSHARKILEHAPTVAFGGRTSHHGRRRGLEVVAMKEDAAAKDLEDLLRDALNTGLDTPRGGGGGTPLIQLKTVPLAVQHLPKRPAAVVTNTPRSYTGPPPPPPSSSRAPDSGPNLAAKLAPDSTPPKALKKSTGAKPRSSRLALGVMAFFALAAAGGAAWRAHEHHGLFASASSPAQAQATPAPITATSENAPIGIALTSRPVQGDPKAEAPKVEVASAPVVVPAAPPTFAVAAAPPPSTAKAEKAEKAEKPEPKKAEPKPEPKHHAVVAAKPAEPKPAAEKPAAAEKPEKKETAAAAPAATPAPSVDALLQQQLKGAIP